MFKFSSSLKIDENFVKSKNPIDKCIKNVIRMSHFNQNLSIIKINKSSIISIDKCLKLSFKEIKVNNPINSYTIIHRNKLRKQKLN